MSGVLVVVVVLVALGVLVAIVNVRARRAGYAIPGRTPVRCDAGHVFVTLWILGGSLTTVRLGRFTRYGRCPVGHHWAVLHAVRDAELTHSERADLYGGTGR